MHSRSQFLGYNSGSRKQCKPIRITVQYNRVQCFLFSIVDITGIYTCDTSCSKSLYQVVSVVLLDLLLNSSQSPKVNLTCKTQLSNRYCIQLDIHKGLLLHYTDIPQKGTFIPPPNPHFPTSSCLPARMAHTHSPTVLWI